jgi:hypothetical protein
MIRLDQSKPSGKKDMEEIPSSAQDPWPSMISRFNPLLFFHPPQAQQLH